MKVKILPLLLLLLDCLLFKNYMHNLCSILLNIVFNMVDRFIPLLAEPNILAWDFVKRKHQQSESEWVKWDRLIDLIIEYLLNCYHKWKLVLLTVYYAHALFEYMNAERRKGGMRWRCQDRKHRNCGSVNTYRYCKLTNTISKQCNNSTWLPFHNKMEKKKKR